MANNFVWACDKVLDNWKPIPRYTVYKVQDEFESKREKLTGIELSYE